MKEINQTCTKLICGLIITVVATAYCWKSSRAYGEDIDASIDVHTSVSTRGLMEAMGSSMAKILEGILKGNFDIVIKESNKIAGISKNMVDMFFPENTWGLEGRKFKVSDDAMKDEYEKYIKAMAEATRNLADVSKNRDTVETYEVFDSMLKNLCFECHKVSRTDWPAWSK